MLCYILYISINYSTLTQKQHDKAEDLKHQIEGRFLRLQTRGVRLSGCQI